MSNLAKSAGSKHVIMDIVCPTRQLRNIVAADVNIFMTIAEGRFEDTNKLFELPADSEKVSYTIHEKDADQETQRIANGLMTPHSRRVTVYQSYLFLQT